MDRREFLRWMALMSLSGTTMQVCRGDGLSLQVMTVGGFLPADSMGVTLPHEHVLVDFVGADKVSKDRYDPDEVFRVVLPHVRRAKAAGMQTLVECTPAYIGRDPALLARLSSASGLAILTNTGYYGAASRKFIPAHAYTDTVEQLAARWIREWREGIGGTGIRPGFIKTGTDVGKLHEINRKLIRAAAHTHLATGLTIASHSGDGIAVFEQLEILDEEGVDPSAFIWVHAHLETDADLHIRAARAGAWLEFDGLRDDPNSIRRHLDLVQSMKEHGLLERVLVSHDAGWYHVGEPEGGVFRPFDTLFTRFIPGFKEAGASASDVQQITITNPMEAFAIRVRRKG